MKRLLVLVCVFELFVSFHPQAVLAQVAWTQRHLFPQTSNLSSIVAFENGLAVSVGVGGVVERSTDTGKMWAVQTEGSLTLNGIASLDGQHFVAVSSEGTSLSSQDSGITWTLTNIPGNPPLNSIAAINSISFIAVGNGGILKASSDAGSQWSTIASGITTSLNSVVVIDQRHLVVCGDSGIVLRSTDGGASWVSSSSVVKAPLRHLALTPEGHIFAYGDKWSVLESLDSGKTWKNIVLDNTNSSHYPNATVRNIIFFSRTHGFAFAAQDPYILLNDYVTDDGGQTWQIEHIVDNNDDDASAALIDTSRAIKVGQAGGIYYTSNQGNTWSQVNSQILELSAGRGLTFSTTAEGFALSQTGIYRTTNAGFDWNKEFTTTSTVTGILFPNSTLGYAYGNGFISRTIDSGATWTTISPPNIGSVASMSFSSSANGVLLKSPATLMITTDSGSSWNQLQCPSYPPNSLTNVTILGLDTLILLGGDEVFFSTNQGAEWDSTTLPYIGNNMSFTSSGIGWIVGTVTLSGQRLGSGILFSTDLGATWATQYLDTTHLDFAGQKLIAIYDQSNAIASISGGAILETHDRGNSWERDTTIDIPSNDFPGGLSYPSVNTAYVLSESSILWTGVFVSSAVKPQMDSSSTFIAYPNPSTNSISIPILMAHS
jgi:photosystem II stability/assembly factor-like uncharacterized protein